MPLTTYPKIGSGTLAVQRPPIQAPRDPTATDIQDVDGAYYKLGQEWINTLTAALWFLQGPGQWEKVSTSAGNVDTLTGDSGTATPAAGNIKIAGTANQIVTSGAGSTVTAALTGPYTPATYTAHGVLLGEGTSSIAATAVGTDGQVLTGNSAADPAFAAIGTKSGLTAHGVVLAEGASAFVASAVGTDGQVLTGNSGADPSFAAIGTKSGLTAHGVLLAEGASAFVASAVGATGQVLSGVTGADPVFANLSELNIVDVTGSSQAMSVATTYIADAASATVAFTLPASASRGDVIRVLGNGPGGWTIAQNANQAIKFSSQSTTVGVNGQLASTNRYNSVTLRCVVGGASTIWNIDAYSGSFTFV